ncbi:hypothetical protein BKA56DRAFT_661156 [Ilyonectria sp. MPI-CAGE-AT-0026]|nr:hypothetical protein BKA56DRAFT_661156 [Ilyonectria sp. MPI-CAGE-AT-0026]
MAPSLDFLLEFRDHERQRDLNQQVWYIVGAVALTACNQGARVTELYQSATQDLPLEDKKVIQRRIKEAILKSSPLTGMPRALRALLPLYESISDDEIDNYAPRIAVLEGPDATAAVKQIEARAQDYFSTIAGPGVADKLRGLFAKHQPDLYLIGFKWIYEYWFSEDAILSRVETQMCTATANACTDAPNEALWHTRGIIRMGGSKEQAQFVQDIFLRIAQEYGARTEEIIKISDPRFDTWQALGDPKAQK